MSGQEIPDRTLDLQEQERVRFKSNRNRTPQKLGDYLRSSQAYWYWIIIVLASVTALLVFIIPENAFPLVYARYILGSISVLWLPGHAFIRALFPKKELDTIESFALSIGMSLTLVSITGLILNYTPWGIRLIPTTLSLLALTCIFATAAAIREHQTQRTTKNTEVTKFHPTQKHSEDIIYKDG